MKSILVTGSEGQLGKCIQKTAMNYIDFDFVFHSSKTLDITNVLNISEVFSSRNFDYCINCAAYTNVEQAEKTSELAYAVNAEGVKNIANACLKHKVVLIHISTDYVFDGEKETPYTIIDETNPINEYGKSKLAGEKYIQEILKQYFIVRTSWLYSEFGKNFYKTILDKAKTEKMLHITDEQTGSPTNANNLATYILNFIAENSKNYGIHHFTDGEIMTWYEFANRIIKENQLECIVQACNYSTFAKRPKKSILK